MSVPVKANIEDDVLQEDFECISIDEATSMVTGNYWTGGYKEWKVEGGLRIADYIELHAYSNCRESEELCKLIYQYIDMRIEYFIISNATNAALMTKELNQLNEASADLWTPMVELIETISAEKRNLLLRISAWDRKAVARVAESIDEQIAHQYPEISYNDKFDIFRTACNMNVR